jgi:hypothetical protein
MVDEMVGRLVSPADIERFALAGNATLTLRSEATGTRYTYKITQAKFRDGAPNLGLYFVKVLMGADNDSDFTYLGLLRLTAGDFIYDHGMKSRIGSDAPSARAFRWFWGNLIRGQVRQIEVWHEGRCGRCNRKLTVPESVESGFGPECINYVV